jgi:hypothetical protein
VHRIEVYSAKVGPRALPWRGSPTFKKKKLFYPTTLSTFHQIINGNLSLTLATLIEDKVKFEVVTVSSSLIDLSLPNP